MWDYIQDDLTSVVYVNTKDKSLTIKVYGFSDEETAETFAHYTMSILNFDYNTPGYGMPSKLLH